MPFPPLPAHPATTLGHFWGCAASRKRPVRTSGPLAGESSRLSWIACCIWAPLTTKARLSEQKVCKERPMTACTSDVESRGVYQTTSACGQVLA
eukprot:3142802-Pyramimonas_sp.AAC.2